MTAGLPRTARLVDPATRQMAEDLARRSGLTLSEWLSRLMADGPEDVASQDDSAPGGGYLDGSHSGGGGGAHPDPGRPVPDEVGRVSQAIERLSDRIETAETRQALAISGVERSVREVIGRIDAAELEQLHTGARLEGALQEARAESQAIVPRVEIVEREQLQLGSRLEACVQGLRADTARLAERSDGLERGQVAAALRLEEIAADLKSEIASRTDAIVGRTELLEREQMMTGARLESAFQEVKNESIVVTRRLEATERDVTRRLDAAERDQVKNGARLEAAYQEVRNESGGLSRRLEAAERGRAEAADRLTGAVEELRAETGELGERLRDVTADGPGAAAKLSQLESSLGAVSGQIETVERKTREALNELASRIDRVGAAEQANLGAMRELRNTCTALDTRLGLAERGAQEGIERAAENLSASMEAAREDLSRELAAAADARFERIEQTIAQMSGHVAAAEQRSTSALERMGREVLDVAQALSRRVQAAERQSADAADRAGAEISRMASAVEDRLIRADAIQAAALEKLGGEIARITERLAERIASSERRSAQAIDDVGEQVARVTDRINQRTEHSTSELLDRIRQSEERTARLLEETRQKIDDRLSETNRRLVEQARIDAAAYEAADPGPFGGGPFPGLGSLPAEQPPPDMHRPRDLEYGPAADVFEPAAPFMSTAESVVVAAPEPEPAPVSAMVEPPEPGFDTETVTLEPNVGFDLDDEILAPAPRLDESMVAAGRPELDLDVVQPLLNPVEAPMSAPLTTREVIERARAAARAASEGAASARALPSRGADDSILQGLSFQRRRGRSGGMPGALMTAGVLAVLGLSAGGYMFFEGKPTGKLPRRVADSLTVAGAPPSGASASEPMAAVAVDPTPSLDPASDHALAAQYSAAISKVSTGESGGLEQMQKLAGRGYAPAQFYLAELYQDGKSGLARDAVLSRRWLEKAADGGDRTAMHNLALDYHEGMGGEKNPALAAEWFRRAAELGLLDSQFNLAAIYEHGDGVTANPAEAYKWYLIASRSGDAEARAGALRTRALLSPDARAVAERAAAEFTPERSAATAAAPALTPPPASATPAASAGIVTAQRALMQLGYYQGPTDGVTSPALHLAIGAYQRDENLPVTGAPDAATIAKLGAYNR